MRHRPGFAALDFEALRQTEVGHAVQQAEVDRLRDAPLIGGRMVDIGNAEDAARGHVVNVVASAERFAHRFVPREVGHDAQLDLAVVGGQQ